IVVVLGRHELPEPFTTTALLAAGGIANTVTSAIAGSSNFSRFTGPLLSLPVWTAIRMGVATGSAGSPEYPSRGDSPRNNIPDCLCIPTQIGPMAYGKLLTVPPKRADAPWSTARQVILGGT